MKKKNTTLIIVFLYLITITYISCDKNNENTSNQPPVCIISTPTNGQEIPHGQIITISVDASDIDGTIEEVHFFLDGFAMETVNNAPYVCNWNTEGESIGNHTLKATAFDNDGYQNSHEIIVVTLEGEFGCDGITEIIYGGQIYETIEIGDQCWFKENLNIGTMIPGVEDMNDDGEIEKYCYNDNPANCNIYGGLYQWDEVMQYSYHWDHQGICPEGWHIPNDEEWKILEGYVDSQYPIGDGEWDENGYRGFDSGYNLKSTSGWNYNGNGADLFGFGALAGGMHIAHNEFLGKGDTGYWWSSIVFSDYLSWHRYFTATDKGSFRVEDEKKCGFSVRCLQDD